MIIFLLAFVMNVHADFPRRWENAKGIVEKHEFYPDGEMILKPRDTWQTLFALTFLDSGFQLSKDCIYFRVPGDEPGLLKFKTMPSSESCDNHILSAGDEEIKNVSDLRMSTGQDHAELIFRADGKENTWRISVLKEWKRPEAKLLVSSADYKSPGLIYLSPGKSNGSVRAGVKDGTTCHDIASDCSERSRSTCSECEHGWYEIPNGCKTGPKVCGPLKCGRKDQPACRRGYGWQRKEVARDCRINSDFAWCEKGLSVFCDGDRALCR